MSPLVTASNNFPLICLDGRQTNTSKYLVGFSVEPSTVHVFP